MPREFLNNLIFGTVEEEAERERAEGAYKPGKGGLKEDEGDRFRNFISGRGDKIKKEAEKQHVDNLTQQYGTTTNLIKRTPGNSLEINKDTDPDVFKQQLAIAVDKDKGFQTMLGQAGLNNVVVNPEKIKTANDGYSLIARTLKERKTAKEEKAEKKAEAQRLTLRKESKKDLEELRLHNKGLRDAEIIRQDRKEARDILGQDRKDARSELTRAQEKKDALELRRDNMTLEYARLDRQDRQTAQDRKDKALMTLLQGLGNLGAAFTI